MDNNQKIVVKASLTKKIIFKIGVQVMEHRCISAAVSRDEWIWHYSFGNLNSRYRYKSKRQGMVLGLPQISMAT